MDKTTRQRNKEAKAAARAEQEKALDASMSALVEVMQKSYSVGKLGFPERVCRVFDGVLRDAMRYARDIRAAKAEVRE